MAGSSKSVATNGQQTIEQLQERYKKLDKQKTQAETTLELARGQLAALQKDAREKYGTDDLTELQAKLAAMQAENEQKRAAYQAELERIETDLAAVEQRFAAAGSSPEKAQ
jgi:chromosome segregation ATPase